MFRLAGGGASKDEAGKAVISLEHALNGRLCLSDDMPMCCMLHTEKPGPPPDSNPPLVVTTSFSDAPTNNIVRLRECDIETTSDEESCPIIEATSTIGHTDHRFDGYSSRQF